MAIAENIPAEYREISPQLIDLIEPSTKPQEECEIDGSVIPITGPNFLGMVAMGVRFLDKDEYFDPKDTHIREVSFNGNGSTIPHDHRTDILISRNPRTGAHELNRQSAAIHLDMLLMHLEVKERAAQEGREFIDYRYNLIDSQKSVYENLSLVNLLPVNGPSPTIKAEAVFELYNPDNEQTETIQLPVGSIAAIAPVKIENIETKI
jgi:hypothetical protein